MKETDAVGYMLPTELFNRLQQIERELQGGTDRERDYGHKIWLILGEATPVYDLSL
jgi:hypothetical protein